MKARIAYLEGLVEEYEKLKLENSLLTATLMEENQNLDKFNATLYQLKLLGDEESREISSCLSDIERTTQKVESLKDKLQTGKGRLKEITKEITEAKNELNECKFRLEESRRSTKSSIDKFRAERENKVKAIDAVIGNPTTPQAGILSSRLCTTVSHVLAWVLARNKLYIVNAR